MPVYQTKSHSALFVHIPKTAGTSIRYLFQKAGFKESYYEGGKSLPNTNYVTRCSPQHFHKDIIECVFDLERFDYIFTIVRDPIERIKSEVRWRKKHFNKDIDPDSWVHRAFDRYAENPYIHDNHIRPQSDFLCKNAEVYRLEDGFSGLTRNLSTIFPKDFRQDTKLENKMVSKEFRIDLSQETVDRARDFYRIDFETFGY